MMRNKMVSLKSRSPIREALDQCRPFFWSAVAFSFFINMLLLAVPLYTMQVLDRVLTSGSKDTLLMLTLIVAISLIFAHGLQIFRAFIFSHIGRWMEDRLSGLFVEKTARLAIYKPAIGSQPLRDLATLKNFVASQAMASIFDAPWAIIFFIVIYLINPILGIVVTGGAILLLVLALIAQKLPAKKLEAANERNIKALQSFEAILRNAEVVKAMGLLRPAHEKWRRIYTDSQSLIFSGVNVSTIIANCTRAIRMGLQAMIIGIGAWLVIDGSMSPGGMIAVSILSGKALAPFDAAMSIYQNWVNAKEAHKRLIELHEGVPQAHRTTDLPEPEGRLETRKLAWQEPTSRRWILRGIGISIAPGEIVGVIGPSGAGKTSLARLLVNVQHPTAGAVCLDGADLSQWDESILGSYTGYLPQDVELFSGTIHSNIARLDDNARDEKVIKASKLANVHDFIVSLPKGYQTDIGTNGAGLSAGQRQRIALARAFYAVADRTPRL